MDNGPLRLIYGLDPWAEDPSIGLIVLREDLVDLLYQMRSAKTWGAATRGHPEILGQRNEARIDAGDDPIQPGDPFHWTEESMPEYGAAFMVSLGLNFSLHEVFHQLAPDVARGWNDEYWVRDDNTAHRALALLKQLRREDVFLRREDGTVGFVRGAMF